MKFYQSTLANGLTVVGEHSEDAVSTAVGFFVKTGSRDETQQISGVSHFLEHMMFKGTEKRSALDITYGLGALGAQANAYTTEETTVYYASVLPEYFEDVFELLSDMMRPSLDAEEFITEKKVILEEIALYQDRPGYLLFEAALLDYFSGHPAGNRVLGTTESVGGMTREQMCEYFNSRYTAPNIVLGVSGCFDWKRVEALSEKYCASWPNTFAGRDIAAHTPTKGDKTVTKANLQTSHLCLVGPAPAANDEERFSAYVLGCIMGDARGSRAYWELVDKGLAESASVEADDMDGTGVIIGYVSAAMEHIDEAGAILRSIMESPLEFSDDDLKRAKTKIATRLVLNGESSMRRLMAVGNNWIFRSKYTTLAEELASIEQVSRSSIEKAVEKFELKPYTTVRVVPE